MPNINTADLTSHDYLLPDDLKVPQYNPLSGQHGTGAQAPVFNLKPQSDLEDIDGRHQDYYKKYAALQKFHGYMWANHHIDVTRPDPSNPDAVQGSQIYHKLLADVMSEGDKLHQAKQRSDYMMKGIAEGRLTAPGEALREHLGTNITSNQALAHLAGSGKVSDFATGIEKEMKGYYDQGEMESADKLREQALQHLHTQYQDAVDNNRLGEAEHIQHDIAFIGNPSMKDDWRRRNADRDFALRAKTQGWRESQGNKDEYLYSDLHRKLSNILDGNHRSFTQSTNTPTPTGGFYLENSEFTGQQYVGGKDKNGKPITKGISKILLDPESDKMFMTFDDGTSMPVPRTGDVMPLMTGFIEANPRVYNMKAASSFVSRNHLGRASGGWNYLVEDNHQEDSRNYQQNAVVRNAHARQVVTKVDNLVGGLSLMPGSKDINIKSNNGNTFKIVVPESISGQPDKSYSTNNVTIESALGKGYNLLVDGKAIIKRKSKEEIQSILHGNSLIGNITDGNINILLGDEDVTPKPEHAFFADGAYQNQGVENDNTGNEVINQAGIFKSSSGTNVPQPTSTKKPNLYE